MSFLKQFTLIAFCSQAIAFEVHADPGAVTPGEPRKVEELPEVEVVSTTPLASTGVDLHKIPGNFQGGDSHQIYGQENLSLGTYLFRNLESVNVNETLNNPFQPDISYRGFTASPLLGTPIGLSVYQDGVRVNESFGDTINWDLIPRFAIDRIELIPGSNPLFGLNTLGGSLSVRTKNGFTHQGTRFQGEGGSFGRLSAEMQHGGSYGNFDWFLGGTLFEDQGWRDHSRSNVKQGFIKVGYDDERTDLDLSYTYAENRLTGNGALPASLVAEDWSSVYAYPEITSPRLHFVNLKLNHLFTNTLEVTGNAYYRRLEQFVYAGDLELEREEEEPGEFEYEDEPVINRSSTLTDGSGGTLQLNYSAPLLGHENRASLGADYVGGSTEFRQSRQEGELEANREIDPEGGIVPITRLSAGNDYYGVFLTDTFSVTPWLHLTGSGRWTQADVSLHGRGTDEEGETTDLDGKHHFSRVNPAAGFTLLPLEALGMEGTNRDLTLYFNYSEGFRVPTPAELACADPQEPCALPTNFANDPPLKAIVARTYETGLRGGFGPSLKWNAAWYRIDSENDILFSNAPGTLTRGFFQNVPSTRREGLELGLSGDIERLHWFANYSIVEATYQSAAVLENAIGPVAVQPGDRMPGVPSQMFKVGFEFEILEGWRFGSDLQYIASQYLRGDDHNRLAPVAEYVTLNINTRYRVHENLELFAMARNLTDERYSTFGLVNRSAYSNPTGKIERFLSPGAPIGAWAGFRLQI